MFCISGYVGDEPAYRHPPAPHYDYAYPPDHHAYPPDPYEYPHAYPPPDPHAYPPDPHAYPPHPDYDYPRPRPARARPPRGRYDYSTVRGEQYYGCQSGIKSMYFEYFVLFISHRKIRTAYNIYCNNTCTLVG